MIVVSAPTGNIGRQVLAHLLSSGEPLRVIARDPSKLPAETRARVEITVGSHSDANVLDHALAGADTVFWLVPADPRAASAEAAYVDFARPAREAFKAHGIERVVSVSALGRGWPKDAGHVTATLKMDDMLAETGVAYRALACASLMENVLRQTNLIKTQGDFHWPMRSDLKAPAVATRDVAAVAARLLLDESWSGVDTIPMLGPEDLSFEEMMVIISDVLGKPVRYHEMPMTDLKAMMLGRGASEGMAQAMVDMATAKNEGLDHLLKRTPADRLNTPTTFRAWSEDVLKPAVLG